MAIREQWSMLSCILKQQCYLAYWGGGLRGGAHEGEGLTRRDPRGGGAYERGLTRRGAYEGGGGGGASP